MRGAGREPRSRPVCYISWLCLARGAKVTDSNLEIDVFLGESAHIVIEAEGVFADLLGGEDEVALSLFLAIHDNLTIGTLDGIVDIKRTTGLNL